MDEYRILERISDEGNTQYLLYYFDGSCSHYRNISEGPGWSTAIRGFQLRENLEELVLYIYGKDDLRVDSLVGEAFNEILLEYKIVATFKDKKDLIKKYPEIFL